MFNPERLLGGLLQSGMRRRGGGLGSLVSGGAALGLVGVAWEAVEHYMNKSQTPAAPSGPPPVAPPAGAPGPVGARPAPPPPPPGAAPPLPSGEAAGFAPTDTDPAGPRNEAVLLIQAMIAAANADGTIDAQERTNILNRLKSVQLSEEEHQFIVHELLAPRPLQDIIGAIDSAELARQVYLVSVLAIEVDTDEELDYLRNLAQGLELDQNTIQEIHQQAGVEIHF